MSNGPREQAQPRPATGQPLQTSRGLASHGPGLPGRGDVYENPENCGGEPDM